MFFVYSLIEEHSNANVGITNNINAKALTAGSQKVNTVQTAAHAPKIAPNVFLSEKTNENNKNNNRLIIQRKLHDKNIFQINAKLPVSIQTTWKKFLWKK